MHIVLDAVLGDHLFRGVEHFPTAHVADEVQVHFDASLMHLTEDPCCPVLPLYVGDPADHRETVRVVYVGVAAAAGIGLGLLVGDHHRRAPEVKVKLLLFDAEDVIQLVGTAAVVRGEQKALAAHHRKRYVRVILKRL